MRMRGNARRDLPDQGRDVDRRSIGDSAKPIKLTRFMIKVVVKIADDLIRAS